MGFSYMERINVAIAIQRGFDRCYPNKYCLHQIHQYVIKRGSLHEFNECSIKNCLCHDGYCDGINSRDFKKFPEEEATNE